MFSGVIRSLSLSIELSGGGIAIDISAEVAYHALALKDDNTVWTWGSNSNGQLGDNRRQF